MRKQFKVTLFGCGRNSKVAGMNIPFDVKKVWGKARVPVTGTINGFKFRTTICPMGGEYFVCVNRFMREGGKCGVGDTVKIVMEPDTAPRIMAAPPDLKKAPEVQSRPRRPPGTATLIPVARNSRSGSRKRKSRRRASAGWRNPSPCSPPAAISASASAPGSRRVQFRIRN